MRGLRWPEFIVVVFICTLLGRRASADCGSLAQIVLIGGPHAVEVNSAANPEPFVVEILATTAPGEVPEYSLEVSTRVDSVIFPYQASPQFSVTIEDEGIANLRAFVRVVGCTEKGDVQSRPVFVYAPGPVTPPDALPLFESTARGEFTLTWPSNSGAGAPETMSSLNSEIIAYDVTFSASAELGFDPIVERVWVPESIVEPETYSLVLSLTNPLDSRLRDLIRSMNERLAAGKARFSGLTVKIKALVQSGELYDYMPQGVSVDFYEELPRVELLTPIIDLPGRKVRVELGEIVLPENGFYSANVARIYYENYGSAPGDYWEIQMPTAGDSVLLVDDQGVPLPPGAITASLFANLIDNQGQEIETILTDYRNFGGLGAPQCWDGVDNDGDGYSDFDGGDPECDHAYDRFEYENVNDLELASRTLVVYNANTTDAREIAEYYAAARGIGKSHICPITVSPGHYAEAWQLQRAASQVRAHICGLGGGMTDPKCAGISGEDLASISPITHIVIIKGIPARLFDTIWPTDGEEPSFDYYLAYSIYNDGVLNHPSGNVDHGNFSGALPDGEDYQPKDSIGSYIRQPDPALDRMVAYGRIEAITTDRTLELIDRTIKAERDGVSGSFLSQGGKQVFDFFSSLSSSLDPLDGPALCDTSAYLDDPDIDWPHSACRSGATDGGLIPGEQILGPEDLSKIQSIPYAVNAGVYIGPGVPPNEDPGHDAFSGFDNLINWRLQHPNDQAVPCTPLCRDLPTPALQEQCRQLSTDYFRELNASCVGASQGLIGWQLRSFPVQYYGFFPYGWNADTGGEAEKIAPTLTSGDPTNGTYAHFGAIDAVENPVCVNPPGTRQAILPCPELIAVRMQATQVVADPIRFKGKRRFRVGFDYRKGGEDSGELRLTTVFTRQGGGPGATFQKFGTFDVASPQADWTSHSQIIDVPDDFSPIDSIEIRVVGGRAQNIRGWLDLDNFEVVDIDDPMQPNLLPIAIGGFESELHESTARGDWASNVIDRLGGIAWWGSSSHHLTGGAAFSPAIKFLGAFYSGRTLGESLSFVGGSAVSGIIYGDPLYRPSGVKIYVDQGIDSINDPEAPYVIVADDPLTWENHGLFINAFHGSQSGVNSGSPYAANWRVSKCPMESVGLCDQFDAWVPLGDQLFDSSDGVNGAFAHSLDTGLMDLVDQSQQEVDQDIILRLRVWIPAQEDDTFVQETHRNDLINYAYFKYLAPAPKPIGPNFAEDDHTP